MRSRTSLHRRSLGMVTLAIALAVTSASGFQAPTARTAEVSELWEHPGEVATHDLRWGPGGKDLAPAANTEFEFKAVDASGSSAGYDVIDRDGRKWDVKTGIEAQPEVIASRMLWAIGYHQPITYFVSQWTLKGGPERKPLAGRFRLSSDHQRHGDWSWHDNPFRGTREMRGLLVANLVLNNWDLKSSQNRIYGFRGEPTRWFVVQDLGASLGKTAWPVGSKLRIDDFESQNLIKSVEDGRVLFDYHARHRELLEDITPPDVAWVCGLLNRITDAQWNDVFTHVGVPGDVSTRFIAKIKSKIHEGLALQPTSRR